MDIRGARIGEGVGDAVGVDADIMGRISVLADSVADQIAAGEVVERPASVVKELVENSLDAGCNNITVELEDGGRTLIRVGDDGCGMDRDDVMLAIDRHATSKIVVAADLIGVSTYGFRGEALPAIASVSRFELETARESTGEGTKITVKGGHVESVETTARGQGTTVTVRNLFFNTPARRKFLRSGRSETRATMQALTVLALSRLEVSFRLTSDGRVLLDAPRVSDVADRIASLFGRSTAEQLVRVDYSTGPVSVRGFVQRPAEVKQTGRKAHLFVNGRPFKDPFLVRAAESGYRATTPPGTRPTLFLSIGIPGDQVDVNVHPAKLEVRFRDRMLVERAVETAVRESLRPIEAAALMGSSDPTGSAGNWSRRTWSGSGAGGDCPPDVVLPDLFAPATSESRFAHVPRRQLIQVLNTYIIFETTDGIAIVDQHSAHERILYEHAMAELNGSAATAQRLLLPLTVDLNAEGLDAVSANGELLTAVGFEVEEFGGRSVVIHAVPNPHPRFDARLCFEELIADLSVGRLGGLNRLERFAATFACKAAIKAGQVLERSEMQDLIDRLFACELPPHDVHGRPTIVKLPRNELERKFGRS
ncbi:MAG: DNA mismatch repair endonuclease MutL [Gemmatimonadales bacterium]